jgi:hypothetical protein
MLVSAHSLNPVIVSAHFVLCLATQQALEAVVESLDPCTNPIRAFGFCTLAAYRLHKRLQYQVGMVAYPWPCSWLAGLPDASWRHSYLSISMQLQDALDHHRGAGPDSFGCKQVGQRVVGLADVIGCHSAFL